MIQDKPTKEQRELIQNLAILKDSVWDAENTQQIIKIAEKAINLSKPVIPLKYVFANGLEYYDDKGKAFKLETLQSEVQLLKSDFYSSIQSEKFAVASSIVSLIAVFSIL